jgi:hypothetical protein
VGDYYVSIERPEGNGFRRGNTINIEYHVQKAFITIIAKPVQRFTYDGNPKPVAAFTDPPADPFTVTYADSATVLPAPPVNKGRYHATIVFTGNERYMGASKEIELWIE